MIPEIYYKAILSTTAWYQLQTMKFQNSIILLLFAFGNAQDVDTSDTYQKFVEEVISEDELYYNDYEYMNENENQIKRERDELAKEAARSRQFTAEKERIQKQREEAFADELAQVKEDKTAAKKLMQQKKRDAKIVKRIFKSFQSNDYYAILGIRNFIFSNLQIPSRSITIMPNHFVIRIPGFELFNISEKQIKKAYREMAKLVHPDKSKDPRAAEAFLLVEDAATILLNDATRSEYDLMIHVGRNERQKRIANQIGQGIEKFFLMTNTVASLAKKLLGPLTIPVVVLVAVIA